MSPSKTTCLLPSLAGDVGKEVVSFLSHLKEVKQLRTVVMTGCENLAPSLIATICEGLCSSNSVEEVEVTLSLVSVLFICLTTPYKAVFLHLTGDSPFFISLEGDPMMLYNELSCLYSSSL